MNLRHSDSEVIKVLAPLSDNPNEPNSDWETPIYAAAKNGHVEVIEVLAPLADNPDEENLDGETPIYAAAVNGHADVIKILAPLSDNPNAPVRQFPWDTPIQVATRNKNVKSNEIVEILTPYI